MNDGITVDILLEFLYNEFAVTIIFCFIGSCLSMALISKKKNESNLLNIKRIVTSTVFSTFLMCASTGYIDLQFEVYAAVSVCCGMWGLSLCKMFANIKFISRLLEVIVDAITNPVFKGVAKSASEFIDEENAENKDIDKKE